MADAYTGEIRLFAGNYAPQDWAFCNGQSIPVSQNPALYSIIGNTYGGTPNVDFKLPDLCGKVPVGMGQGLGLSSRTLGNQIGITSIGLTTNNMPAHTHTVQGKKTSTTATATNDPAAHTWTSLSIANKIYATTANAEMNANGVVPVNGTGTAHNNIQPCVGIYYIICLYGYYPSSE